MESTITRSRLRYSYFLFQFSIWDSESPLSFHTNIIVINVGILDGSLHTNKTLCNTPYSDLMTLFPGPLVVVELVSVPSIGQREIFNHFLRIIIKYLKPHSRMQIVPIRQEYLMIKIINIKQLYLKSFNCVQTNALLF